MPLQTWEIAVHGETHHVSIDRNPDSGKFLVRVDGRVAVKPFAETRADQAVEIGGRPFVLVVDDGRYSLAEKASRYIDSSQPRESSNLGAVTIARGLEHITVVTDQAMLRIEKLSDALKNAAGAGTGGGILGAVLTEAAGAVAQKLVNHVGGPITLKQQVKSFAHLEKESICRFEHLPFDLITLFDDVGLDARVMIVPRRAITALEVSPRKVVTTTVSGKEKFDVSAAGAQVLDHLCAAGYPLGDDDVARSSEAAREERDLRAESSPEPPPEPAAAAPMPSPPLTGRNYSGIPEVRWTSPVMAVIGRDPALESLMSEDAAVWASVYPKTLKRRTRFDETLRDFATARCDIFYLHGTFDDKTRFKDAGGSVISLKDLIVKLLDLRVRMLWIASPNDAAIAKPTLEWAAGQNFFLAFTAARSPDFPALLTATLRELAAGEPLSRSWPRIAGQSGSICLFAGRGESVFYPK